MKKVFLALIAVLSAVVLIGCSKADSNKETLTVGMEAAYAPFNWTVTNQTEFTYPLEGQSGSYVDGYDVQMAKAIAESLNMNLVIKAIEWDGLLPALQTKEIDLIIAGMSPTEERKQEISFTNVYYHSEIVMVVNTKGNYSNATKLDDFTGTKIVAQRGTLYDDLITQIKNVNHQVPLDTYAALAIAVSTNTSDGFVAELPVAKSIVAANPNLKTVHFAPESGFELDDSEITVSVGLRKSDTELLDKINTALAGIDDETRGKWMDAAVIRSEAEITNGIWAIFTKYFGMFMRGLMITILLAVVGTLGGFVVSLLLVALTSTKIDEKRNTTLNKIAKKLGKGFTRVYITLFRGTPMIVQAMIFYYGIQSLGNFEMWTPLLASFIIVILNTAAYIAEIIRGSVNALDAGQNEASVALGMTRRQTLMHVIYPQAIKNSLPSIGNEFIVNLKDTAVLSVIGVLDLFNATRQVVGATYNTISPFIITAIIYLVLTGLTSLLVKKLEERGSTKNA